MTTAEAQAVQSTIHDLMYEHRVRWAASVLGADATDLRAAEDPSAALAGASAALWLDGYEPAARQALIDAAERGARLIVAVPAGTDDGEELARSLPRATVVPQSVASGSLIGAGSDATVEVREPASPERATWLLVCANVETGAADARLDVAVSSQLATRIGRLEEALEALRDANVRLAREKLGRHDAAAGAVIGRAEREAAYLQERFEFEQQLAIQHHEWFQASEARARAAEGRLASPLLRLASKVDTVLRRIPGLRSLVKRVRQS